MQGIKNDHHRGRTFYWSTRMKQSQLRCPWLMTRIGKTTEREWEAASSVSSNTVLCMLIINGTCMQGQCCMALHKSSLRAFLHIPMPHVLGTLLRNIRFVFTVNECIA